MWEEGLPAGGQCDRLTRDEGARVAQLDESPSTETGADIDKERDERGRERKEEVEREKEKERV